MTSRRGVGDSDSLESVEVTPEEQEEEQVVKHVYVFSLSR